MLTNTQAPATTNTIDHEEQLCSHLRWTFDHLCESAVETLGAEQVASLLIEVTALVLSEGGYEDLSRLLFAVTSDLEKPADNRTA